MVEIVLIIGLLFAFIAGFFCAIKSIQLGLRWQGQVQLKQEPTLHIPNPIQPIMDKHEEAQISNILDEYLNGKG